MEEPMVIVTKDVFFDMMAKKIVTQDFKQWNITSKTKGRKRKKRYVSEDVYSEYLKSIE